jgi:hypothetical protein
LTVHSILVNDRDANAPTGGASAEVPMGISVDRSPLGQVGHARRAPVIPIRPKAYIHRLSPTTPLRVPMLVELRRGEDAPIVAFSPTLNLGGAGVTVLAAVKDLQSTICSLWESLKDENSKALDKPARKLRAQIRSLIAE